MRSIDSRLRRLENKTRQWVEDVRQVVKSGQITADEVINLYGLETFTLWPDLFPAPTASQRAAAKEAQAALDAAKPHQEEIAALAGRGATWQDEIAAGIHLGYIDTADVRAAYPDIAETMIKAAQQYEH